MEDDAMSVNSQDRDEYVHPDTGEVYSMSEAVTNRDKARMPLWAYLDKLFRKRQTVDGAELPDPRPMAPPVGFVKQPSMVDIIREQVRAEVSRAAAANGYETLEESDDFYIEDDDDPSSPYEMEHDYEPISEFLSRMTAAEAAAAEKAGAPIPAKGMSPEAPATPVPPVQAEPNSATT